MKVPKTNRIVSEAQNAKIPEKSVQDQFGTKYCDSVLKLSEKANTVNFNKKKKAILIKYNCTMN